MIVKGRSITPEQIAAGLGAMKGVFSFPDVVGALVRAGVTADEFVADRAADRLLQKERRAGVVSFSGGRWTRT